jgi:hypothetical protein
MFTWVELQERINIIFDETRVQKFDTVMEKDKNGWNWILTYHRLETDTTKIIHTKFIFKLAEDKQKLRAAEFLYLYDLNCKYHVVRFHDLGDMDTKIRRVIYQNHFGKNLKALNDFIISPAQTINNFMYEKNVEGYSIYSFDYSPEEVIVPCQKLELNFKFNVNNKNDISLQIKKIGNESFKLTFTNLEESETVEIDDLTTFVSAIVEYMKRSVSE